MRRKIRKIFVKTLQSYVYGVIGIARYPKFGYLTPESKWRGEVALSILVNHRNHPVRSEFIWPNGSFRISCWYNLPCFMFQSRFVAIPGWRVGWFLHRCGWGHVFWVRECQWRNAGMYRELFILKQNKEAFLLSSVFWQGRHHRGARSRPSLRYFWRD